MDKAQLQAEIERLNAEIGNVFAKAEAEKRATTAEELATVTASEAKIEEHKAAIKLLDDAEQARLRHQNRQADLNKGKGRKTQADQVITSQKEGFEDDPKKGFKTPREFMSLVIEAGQGREPDARLKYLTVGSDEARGNSDPAGGFLLPVGFSPELLKIEAENDPMGGLTRKLPMQTTIVKIPSRVDTNHSTSVSGGLTVTRRPETVAATASQVTLSQVVLEAHTLMGLSYATEELLVDSPQSFAALLSAGFSDQFTSHLIGERITGTGVGEFTGVLNAPCLVSVSKETGQAAATIVYENVINMRSRCYGYARAVWLANHDTMPQLMLMNQSVGTGGMPIWQPSAREDHPDLLLGRPLIFTEYCKTVGTVGDLILGNWSEYLEGQYQPLQSAESIHVRFVNHERTFKFWLRNAGQPWWKAALTPKNSTNTLSPFVVCATRA